VREAREAEELAAANAAKKAAKKGKKRVLEVEVASGAEAVVDEWPKPKKCMKTAEAEDESSLEVAEVACKK
jgi:hypothetical protein